MRSPIYVSRPLLNAAPLARYAEAVGLRNVVLPVDMHVTIAYSREPVNWGSQAFLPDLQTVLAEGGKRRISRLGDAVVLEFENRNVSKRWAMMIMAGASWDFPQYIPHVTIAYDPDASLSGIIAPTSPLRFGPERREALDEDWNETTKSA